MADNKIIFAMEGVSKTFPPQKQVLKNIWLSFFLWGKIGVLGLNGSGKSSLLKIIAGVDTNYEGKVTFDKDYKIGYLQQEPQLDESKTVRQIVEEGVQHIVDIVKAYDEINMKLAEPMDDDEMMKAIEVQGELMEKMDHYNAWELDYRLETAMESLRCPLGDTPVNVLSGGERRRVALCRLLLSQPDILLLDEPTNHLDAESVHWLEQYLQNFPGTVIRGNPRSLLPRQCSGMDPRTRPRRRHSMARQLLQLVGTKSQTFGNGRKTESKRRKTLERELEWIRMGAKARQAKGKARLNAYDKLQNEESKEKEAKLELFIPPGPRLGDVVIDIQGVSKAFGNRVLIENFSANIPKNAVVGIIGPNGMGKSTLFKMIMGKEQPDNGQIVIGDTVKLSYVDQSHEDLLPEKTVFEVTGDGNELIKVGNNEVNVRAYLSKFNLGGSDQQKRLACCLVVKETDCIWPLPSKKGATCCCSTNLPTTSMSIH